MEHKPSSFLNSSKHIQPSDKKLDKIRIGLQPVVSSEQESLERNKNPQFTTWWENIMSFLSAFLN